MKPLLCLALCFILAAPAFAEPATEPVTESILNGEMLYSPPDGWKLDGKANDGKRAQYSHASPHARIDFVVLPQQTILTDTYAPTLGQKLCDKLRAGIVAQKMTLTEGPKMEKDDRFFLRIHSRYNKGSENSDQIAIYRVIGKDLVSVIATSFADSPDDAKPVFDDAEKMLLSVKSSKQAAAAASAATHTLAKVMKPATRPTALPQAKITFNAPAGWSEETNDNTSGIVATYHDPAESFNTIAISVRPLPPEAKKDPKARDALIDQIVSGEKAQFKFDGANVVGDSETVKDNRFLKKVRTRYEKADAKIQVTSRQKRIGDVIVSVSMAAMEPAATDIDKLADEVAMSLRGPVR